MCISVLVAIIIINMWPSLVDTLALTKDYHASVNKELILLKKPHVSPTLARLFS